MPTESLASNPAGMSFVDGWIFVFVTSHGKKNGFVNGRGNYIKRKGFSCRDKKMGVNEDTGEGGDAKV